MVEDFGLSANNVIANCFAEGMGKYCGKIVTISTAWLGDGRGYYHIKEDNVGWVWFDDMFEPVEQTELTIGEIKSNIELLYPPDSEYPDTAAIGREIMLKVILENWRILPDAVLRAVEKAMVIKDNEDIVEQNNPHTCLDCKNNPETCTKENLLFIINGEQCPDFTLQK